MENKKLEVGEKYLSIVLLGGALKIAAFPNKNPNKTINSPQYVGDGVKVWVNTKKAEAPKTETVEA